MKNYAGIRIIRILVLTGYAFVYGLVGVMADFGAGDVHDFIIKSQMGGTLVCR